MRRVAWLVVLAACGDSQAAFEPIIDVPSNDSASAFPLDQLTMSVAHAGAANDLVSGTFTHNQTVALAGVPFGDDLVVHLTGFVGTSEVAYGRSCPVAVTADAPPPSPHLYFSRSVKFGGMATDLPHLRTLGGAITYHDGSGLLLGGYDQNTGLPASTVERFDPNTGVLEVLVGEGMIDPRFGAVVAPVGTGADAQIAVIGGQDTSGSGAQIVELIEADQPETRRVQSVPDTNMSRIDLTATALTDGRVIAIGGRPPPNGMPVGDVDEVSVENGTAVVRKLRAALMYPRYGHTTTRLGDDVGAPVLVAGGRDASNNPVAAAELYKPLSESFSPTFNGTMVVPRSHHQAVRMPDGSVLIIGGLDASMPQPQPVKQLELFTLDAGFVSLATELPSSAGVIDFTATTLPDGRVLLTGGRQTPNGPPVASAFIARLDPIDGSVDIVATDQLSVPRAGHQATLLCDGTVLISGGTADQVPAERYNPPPDGRR